MDETRLRSGGSAGMDTQTIYELCTPRADVLAGTSSDSDFAADLAHVVRGAGADEYTDPARFFATTYPTRGLKSLLSNVMARLSGRGGAVAAIFRLDTSFGGGKTHGLIALVHAARGMQGVSDPAEFIDPALLPSDPVAVAAFDGENADPANGRRMGEGVLAHTPWGELAYALAGSAGFERVRRSDEEGIAPGAETIAELFGDQPALILLDELSIYLRKIKGRPAARDQLTAFLTSLFKAVESSPRAALVYTLAVGKDGKAGDAYSDENQYIADKMAEAESVSARKATLLNPTEDDETAQVLRRRLFERVDDAAAKTIIDEYRRLWQEHRDALAPEAVDVKTLDSFSASYPLHPDVLATFTRKTATIANFQRVRGMLRILGRTVARLWALRPSDATAIHLHHIDPGYEPIRQEIVTRLGQAMYVSAIRSDVAGEEGRRALAQELDDENYHGMPPYTAYVTRTVLMHSLAFNDQLKGLTADHLRYAMLGPRTDISFGEAARQRFVAHSAYLDDRPGAPLRFLTEANLTQMIRREEGSVDPGDVRKQLDDRIREVFDGSTFELVKFPGGPWEVPDEVGNQRPLLVVPGYDACSVGTHVDTVPDLISEIWQRKGADGGSLRALRNNLVFVAAEDGRIEDMRQKMARGLALRELKTPARLAELADHQQQKVRELEGRAEAEVAIAIQQCFRHIFYPSRNQLAGADTSLAYAALETHAASERPGAGQQAIVRRLREDERKLRLPEDEPDSPVYVRDHTPLKRGQITTSELREEFRRDPKLPMLINDGVFVKGIRRGVEQGEYVYRRGDLIYGQGDPNTSIMIDEQATVFTMAYAKDHGIWPRPKPKPTVADVESMDEGAGSLPGTIAAGTNAAAGEGRAASLHASSSSATRTSAPMEPDGPRRFSHEGLLREALVRVWEQVRSARVDQIGTLTIRMFNAVDVFRLLNVAAAVRQADRKTVTVEGGYITHDGSHLGFEYNGTLQDAQPLKDFLEPQLRAAAEKNLEARFELGFKGGLSMSGDGAEKLTEQLTKFAAGSAYVEAIAVEAMVDAPA